MALAFVDLPQTPANEAKRVIFGLAELTYWLFWCLLAPASMLPKSIIIGDTSSNGREAAQRHNVFVAIHARNLPIWFISRWLLSGA
jgi:hypothetical protein